MSEQSIAPGSSGVSAADTSGRFVKVHAVRDWNETCNTQRMVMKLVSMLMLGAVVIAGCGGGGGGADSSGADSIGAYGLDERAAVSGLQIPTGVANSTQLKAVNAFPNLGFNTPTFITHAGDGSNRLFVTGRFGGIQVFNNSGSTTQSITFLDLTPLVDGGSGESGLLGMAFDPGFKTNGFFYVSYVTKTTQRKLRIARYRVSSGNANVADPNSALVVLDIDHPAASHFGGWIGFGPDGLLYISTGDGEDPNGPQNTASMLGKVLRIRVNANGSVSIPSDNPFGNAVWASGFRNPWRCSFDRGGNRDLFCGDVGQSDREEVNRIKRGANYGWPVYEGSLTYSNPSNLPFSNFEPAVHEYDHTVGMVVIGGYVYRGPALPAMTGRYLYTDAATSNLWAITLDGNGKLVSNTLVATNVPQVQAFGEDEAGELYGASALGTLQRFEPAAAASSGSMPATLSATGIFTDLARLTTSAGIIDYEVNSPFWSDGASKRRWLALPGAETIAFSATEPWTFPVGTVAVKHFELPLAAGGTTRVETRVLVQRSDGWVGYTYRWRADQSDADLLINGAVAAYDTVDPANGNAVRVDWTFPSQAQCLGCHTQASGRVLGINTRQLNRNHSFNSSGRSDNLLRTFNHIGLFSQDIGDAAQYGAMPDPKNSSAAVDQRARAYLDSNCSQCHRPGGPTPVTIDLRYDTALADTDLVGISATVPTTAGALRIAPGNHGASDLWKRVAANGANRMPPLGSNLVDQQAVDLLSGWIDGLR
jgi:uncharacterized repeat protein (TIGR03806 family)